MPVRDVNCDANVWLTRLLYRQAANTGVNTGRPTKTGEIRIAPPGTRARNFVARGHEIFPYLLVATVITTVFWPPQRVQAAQGDR